MVVIPLFRATNPHRRVKGENTAGVGAEDEDASAGEEVDSEVEAVVLEVEAVSATVAMNLAGIENVPDDLSSERIIDGMVIKVD